MWDVAPVFGYQCFRWAHSILLPGACRAHCASKRAHFGRISSTIYFTVFQNLGGHASTKRVSRFRASARSIASTRTLYTSPAPGVPTLAAQNRESWIAQLLESRAWNRKHEPHKNEWKRSKAESRENRFGIANANRSLWMFSRDLGIARFESHNSESPDSESLPIQCRYPNLLFFAFFGEGKENHQTNKDSSSRTSPENPCERREKRSKTQGLLCESKARHSAKNKEDQAKSRTHFATPHPWRPFPHELRKLRCSSSITLLSVGKKAFPH